ncbi:MAG: pyridoxal-phosphate dependent enzyme [Gammaproteobacteria bacterium]|nr:pyridoxal-phosphate dependent enzyme [Gammaproteobacteria bacterium]
MEVSYHAPMLNGEALHIRTPIFRDMEVEAALGKTVWLKMECLQPTGSFKIRGIGLLCQELKSSGCTRFVCSSGGNAGYAVAYAGRELSLPVLVVVPSTTPDSTRQALILMGAEVQVIGDVWDEADVEAQELALEEGVAYIPPFDHPTLWRGHSSLIDEVAESHGKPDLVVVTVGGGGLLCGVLEGMHRSGWFDVPLVAVETAGAESLHAAMSAGEPVLLSEITSIAKCLGARRVADAALKWTGKHPVRSVVVSDDSAVRGCVEFANRHRILVEPACGAGLSLIYERAECLADAQRVLIVVCGGIGVDIDQLNRWVAQIGSRS